ncbi:MAG: NFACT RNA binding domain-containing protein [Eubacteriales bacterium]
MPLDGICVTHLVTELKDTIIGGKIDKIYQPGRDEIILSLRSRMETGHGTVKLLLSASPQHPRVHLTQISRENPAVPPMFCMLLRKHLVGAKVLDITQPPMERVIEFQLEALDELGFRVSRRLILEVLGVQSNIILVDEKGRIIDCIRRIHRDLSTMKDGESVRQVMSGFFYQYPPSQNKMNPFTESVETLQERIAQGTGQADKFLLSSFSGISPLISRELNFLVTGAVDTPLETLSPEQKEALGEKLFSLRQEKPSPCILFDQGKPKDFSFREISQYQDRYEQKNMTNISSLLDAYYKEQEQNDRIRQKGQGILRNLTNARDRVERKIVMQEQELLETENRDKLRELGDIITANLHRMSQGMTALIAEDFYHPDCQEIEIKLDPLLSPQKNAAIYYKNYNRSKKANEMLQILIEKGKIELDYLNSVLEHCKLAQGEQDLLELRQELEDTGYLKKAKKIKGKEKRISGKAMEFVSSSGLRISVGKNNLQNDRLTTKQAFKSDIWFHTQKIHGSHVILWTEGKEPDAQSLQEAATLAAWFSQGKEMNKVPVDYTPVKYVKKPNGARPGMVIYSTYETAMVFPDESLVEGLRKK